MTGVGTKTPRAESLMVRHHGLQTCCLDSPLTAVTAVSYWRKTDDRWRPDGRRPWHPVLKRRAEITLRKCARVLHLRDQKRPHADVPCVFTRRMKTDLLHSNSLTYRIFQKRLPHAIGDMPKKNQQQSKKHNQNHKKKQMEQMVAVTPNPLKSYAKLRKQLAANPRVDAIMKSFIFPFESSPMRNPCGTSSKTTVFRPHLLTSLDFTSPVATADDCVFRSPGQMVLGISDDPLHSIYLTSPGTGTRIYQLYFNDFNVTTSVPEVSASFLIEAPGPVNVAHMATPLPIVYQKCTNPNTAPAMTPSIQYCFSIGGRNGMMVNCNANHAATVSFASANAFGGGASIRALQLTGSTWQPLVTAGVPTLSGTLSLTLYEAGIYAFEYIQGALTSGGPFAATLVVTESGTNAIVTLPCPGLYNRCDTLATCSVRAASILCSQRCPELYRGGEIVARQFPSSHAFWEGYDYDEIASFPDSIPLVADNGVYAFLRPSNFTTLPMQNLFGHGKGNFTSCDAIACTSPYPPSGMVLIALKMPLIGGTPPTYPGAMFTCLFAFGVECENVDTWCDPEKPQVTVTEYNLALEALRDVDNIHENPTHWRDLTRMASRALGATARYAPTLIRGLTSVLPHIANFAGWLGGL